MLECVLNLSEGRDRSVIERIAATAGGDLLDVHSDPHHNRSVLTLIGEEAPRAVTEAALSALDLRNHEGVHPRFGIVDVVPFVPLHDSTMVDALRSRDAWGRWAADLGLPSFVYGPERTLPVLRRDAFVDLEPTFGPRFPHPTAGATALGARPALIAWNLWLSTSDPTEARAVASRIRTPQLRTLGLMVGDRVQLSMNLVDPSVIGPAQAFDAAAAHTDIVGAELVGLIPESVLRATPRHRWAELDLDNDKTIEARLGSRR